MSYLAINSMGLAADIVGVALVFTYGLPANISRTGATYIIGEQNDEAEIAEAERYDRWARCGLVLLIFGFGSQIVSNWLQAVQQTDQPAQGVPTMADPVAVCTTFWACVHEFQILTAGILAVGAAATTGYLIWKSANLPIAEQARRDKETAANRKRHECLVLLSQLRTLRRRSRQAASTIRVYIAANKDVSDAAKEKIYLAVPAVITNWEVMSMLPPDVVAQCLDLTQKLEDHNFDIAGAGGTFGADNFRRILFDRLTDIQADVGKLANDLTAAAQ